MCIEARTIPRRRMLARPVVCAPARARTTFRFFAYRTGRKAINTVSRSYKKNISKIGYTFGQINTFKVQVTFKSFLYQASLKPVGMNIPVDPPRGSPAGLGEGIFIRTRLVLYVKPVIGFIFGNIGSIQPLKIGKA